MSQSNSSIPSVRTVVQLIEQAAMNARDNPGNLSGEIQSILNLAKEAGRQLKEIRAMYGEMEVW